MQCKDVNWEETVDLIPTLRHFAENADVDETTKEIAFSLQVALATHGRVQLPPTSDQSQASTDQCAVRELPVKTEGQPTKDSSSGSVNDMHPVIEIPDAIDIASDDVISEDHDKLRKPSSADIKVSENSVPNKCPPHENLRACDESMDLSFEEAMKMSEDPIVPLRGHAIICLRRHVDSGNEEALNAAERIFGVCLLNIGHEDSYIYLSTAQLMAAIVVRWPATLLTRLVNEYLSTEDGVERRMKLGEVLVKTSSVLG